MTQRFVRVVVLAATIIAPSIVHAQSDNDFAGYAGLIGTPTGGFVPMNNVLGLPEAKGSLAFEARYARWKGRPADLPASSIGVGITTRQNSLATTFELGYLSVSDCRTCSEWMGGVDMQLPLGKTPVGAGSAFEIGLNPAVGIGRTTGDLAETVMGASLSLPMALSFGVGQHGTLVPFVSPGFGIGHIAFSGESITGTRAMFGAGATLANADWPIRVTAGVRKVVLQGSPTIFGIGVSLNP